MADIIEGLVARLTIPGLPSWVAMLLLAAIAVTVLAFLAMPFAVFGVKSRLEAVEMELADLRAEIRALIRQAPAAAPPPRATVDEDYIPRATARAPEAEPRIAPPVPPPAARPERAARRTEPRIDWPRADKSA